jgi:hypothetical protein
MSDRYPNVFGRGGHGRHGHDDEGEIWQDRRPVLVVPCVIAFNGLQGELPGQVRVANGIASAEGAGGSPRVQIDLGSAVFTQEPDGALRCASPQVGVRSSAPEWLAWHRQGGIDRANGYRQHAEDRRGGSDRYRSSDSSGLLPVFGHGGHGLGLSQFFARWKGWQLALAAGIAVVVGLALIALVIVVVIWGLGQLKDHGGDLKKALAPAIERSR